MPTEQTKETVASNVAPATQPVKSNPLEKFAEPAKDKDGNVIPGIRVLPI